MATDAKDNKESKEKKSKAPKTDGVETTGRVAKARSAVSSGASKLASGVSNNKKSLGIGAAAAAVAAAGVVAVVKSRKKSAATSSDLDTEASVESTLGTDGTAAEPLV